MNLALTVLAWLASAWLAVGLTAAACGLFWAWKDGRS
jgi:hypothetical protein